MSYQPIYDGEFDVVLSDEQDVYGLLEAVFRHKLIVTGWVTVGPGGGNPSITLRGTRRQFMGWFNDYYDVDGTVFDRTDEGDSNAWANAVDAFSLKFVA
jgi:hypothetical protein